jgi:hypothetical protein
MPAQVNKAFLGHAAMMALTASLASKVQQAIKVCLHLGASVSYAACL